MHGDGVLRAEHSCSNQKIPCTNPNSVDCLSCYANWRPQIPKSGRFLIKMAEHLSPLISPTTLHRFWKRVPDKFRIPISTETMPHHVESEEDLHQRNEQFNQLAKHSTVISPSHYLRNSHTTKAGTTYKTFHMDSSTPTTGTVTSEVMDCCL